MGTRTITATLAIALAVTASAQRPDYKSLEKELPAAENGWISLPAAESTDSMITDIFRVTVPLPGKVMSVTLNGVGGKDWKYQCIGLQADSMLVIGETGTTANGTIVFYTPKGKQLERVWLTVSRSPESNCNIKLDYNPASAHIRNAMGRVSRGIRDSGINEGMQKLGNDLKNSGKSNNNK